MKRRGTAAALLAAAACMTVLFAVRCGDNESESLLDPQAGTTVAEGVISGILDYGVPGPYPETYVFAIPYYNPSCEGGITSIHVTGEYNNWDESSWDEPGMEEIFPCLWWQKIALASAEEDFLWKFVTNKAWDNSYGSGGGTVDEVARRGPTVRVSGENNLSVSIPAAGEYWFLLNASTDPAYFWIADEDEVLWDSLEADSTRFTIENLEASVYTVIIWVRGDEENFPVRYIRGVRVSGDEGTFLDTVEVVPSGVILGAVAFDDAPAAPPAVSITVTYSESGSAVDTVVAASGDSAFAVSGLSDDMYDLRFHAAGYVDTVVEAIDFTAERDTDLGTITLVRGGAAAGTVALQDDPADPPAITVTGLRAADGRVFAATAADSATGAYILTGLPAGLVDLEFRAQKYRDTTFTDIAVTAAETTDVGLMTLTPGCVSVATTIHILGEFNGWDEALFTADPGMDPVESCLWRDTVEIGPAYLPEPEFKFVTDGAYTVPADYVLCEGEDYDSLGGPVCLIGEGSPPNLVLTKADRPGRYEFTLDESTPAYQARLLEEFNASIGGTIAYDTGLEPPFPPVAASATRQGDASAFATASVEAGTGDFTLTGLDAGTYDVTLSGSNLSDTTLTGIAVTAGGSVDLGTITVTEVTCQSEFTVIRVVGDFNSWNTSAPSMIQIEPCLWVDTLEIASPGCYFMKFRTGSDWTSNDYYNCGAQDENCQVPLTGSLCHNGTAGDQPALGKIQFEAGTYEFRLDEATRTYAITKLE